MRQEIKLKYIRDDRNWKLEKHERGNGIDLYADAILDCQIYAGEYINLDKAKENEKDTNGYHISALNEFFIMGEKITFYKGDVVTFGLGVAMELPQGYFANVRPRSSIFNNFKAMQVNSVGLIDDSYNGDSDEWRVQILFLDDVEVKRGDRLCQFTLEKMIEVEFEEVKTLNNKNRGGFGTSGK